MGARALRRGLCLCLLAACRPALAPTSPPDASAPTEPAEINPPMQPSPELSTLLTRLAADDIPSTLELMDYGRRPGAVAELLAYFREQPPDDDPVAQGHKAEHRRLLLPIIIELGRVMVPAEGDAPEHPGPIVVDDDVVGLLVEQLFSGDPELRSTASTALAGLVPASELEPFTASIHRAAQLYPTADGMLILLGKSADPEQALAILDRTPSLGAADSDNVIMVRARLGDRAAEDALYLAYQDADGAQERGALARRLGYAGTPRLVELLAQEVRSPDHYVWHKQSRRSLRLHVIEGLHLAYPTEPVFWRPYFTPEDDGYYQEVEAWLTANLGTTWKRPRPEFLYEETAPSSPGTGF